MVYGLSKSRYLDRLLCSLCVWSRCLFAIGSHLVTQHLGSSSRGGEHHKASLTLKEPVDELSHEGSLAGTSKAREDKHSTSLSSYEALDLSQGFALISSQD